MDNVSREPIVKEENCKGPYDPDKFEVRNCGACMRLAGNYDCFEKWRQEKGLPEVKFAEYTKGDVGDIPVQ